MFTYLGLKNFRAFESLGIELAPITVLVGPNNSGKSSIISGLRLLAQTALSEDFRIPLLLNGSMGDFGTHRDIAFQNKKGRFPADGFDKVYIAVANNTKIRYIVSHDMDFFEPKLKKGEERAKCRARDDRRGSVCCYLRREMNIKVGTPVHAHAELLTH